MSADKESKNALTCFWTMGFRLMNKTSTARLLCSMSPSKTESISYTKLSSGKVLFDIKSVDVNHVDKIANQTPLFYAAREGHLDMCKILIEAGCDIIHMDSNNKTAAHYAKKYNNNEVCEYLSN